MWRYALLTLCLASLAIADDVPVDTPTPPERDAELQELVDPILHWRRPTVAPDQNAWTDWQHAVNTYVPYDRAGVSHEFHDVEFDLDTPWFDREQNVAMVSKWLDANAAAFDAIDRGLERPHLQMQAELGGVAPMLPDRSELRALTTLRLQRARLRAAQGNTTGAVDDLVRCLRVGLLLRRGETLIDFLLGTMIESESHQVIQQLSANLTPEQRKQIASVFSDEADPHTGLLNAYRAEFWRLMVWEADKLHRQITAPAKAAKQPLIARIERETGAEAAQVAKAVGEAIDAFFDRDTTIKLASVYHARYAQNARKPWTKRDLTANEEIEALALKINDRYKALAEVCKDQQPDDSPQVTKDRAKHIKQITQNLIGEHLVTICMPNFENTNQLNRRLIAARHATLITLATHTHETQHGKPPADLDTLVKTKLLPAPPADPFGDSPMKYDPQHRLVWSNGKDGDNDHGQGYPDGEEPRHHGEDLVWRIAPPPAN